MVGVARDLDVTAEFRCASEHGSHADTVTVGAGLGRRAAASVVLDRCDESVVVGTDTKADRCRVAVPQRVGERFGDDAVGRGLGGSVAGSLARELMTASMARKEKGERREKGESDGRKNNARASLAGDTKAVSSSHGS